MSDHLNLQNWDCTDYRSIKSLENEKYKVGDVVYICFNGPPVKTRIEHVYEKKNTNLIKYILKNPESGWPTWDQHYEESEIFSSEEAAEQSIKELLALRIKKSIYEFEQKYNEKFE